MSAQPTASQPQTGGEPMHTSMRAFVGRSLGLRDELLDLEALSGATQAQVWSVRIGPVGSRAVLRVVNRPVDLLRRQAEILDVAAHRGATVARIIEVEPHGSAAFQLCEWMPGTAPNRERSRAAWLVGKTLATFHRSTAGMDGLLSDRPLELLPVKGLIDGERTVGDGVQSLLRTRHRTLRRWSDHFQHLVPNGVIHGDAHPGNVMVGVRMVGLIDFDKMMVGPRVFDVAKYITTSCFRGTLARPVFQRDSAEAVVDGYESVQRLSQVERASINSLCILLIAENDAWIRKAGIEDLSQFAERSARWFGGGLRRTPIAIERVRRTRRADPAPQMPLFEEPAAAHPMMGRLAEVTGVQLELDV